MLRQLIEKSKKTQAEIAQTLGVHQTLISLWVRGKCRPPITIISKLADTLGCSVDDVVSCFDEK